MTMSVLEHKIARQLAGICTRKTLRGFVAPVSVKPERVRLYQHSAARKRAQAAAAGPQIGEIWRDRGGGKQAARYVRIVATDPLTIRTTVPIDERWHFPKGSRPVAFPVDAFRRKFVCFLPRAPK